MKKETFEVQNPFAGEKKPSMNRRCIGHDYQERQMYMVTMVTEGRKKYFGEVVMRQQTERNTKASGQRDREHGLLFAPNYNDKLLLRGASPTGESMGVPHATTHHLA